jgi:hypothetical protein
MGTLARETLPRQIAGDDIKLPGELFVRGSTAPPKEVQ